MLDSAKAHHRSWLKRLPMQLSNLSRRFAGTQQPWFELFVMGLVGRVLDERVNTYILLEPGRRPPAPEWVGERRVGDKLPWALEEAMRVDVLAELGAAVDDRARATSS